MKSRAYNRYLLALLMSILAVNYVDRWVLGLVQNDIKADLHLSDAELGFLSGIAFALFYAVMGIPIARWADRGNRVTIISLCTAIWSAAVALCGVAGFKPTRTRVPLVGAFPLSTTLDSVGPLAPTAACCATIFQVLAGESPRSLTAVEFPGLRLGVPKNHMLEDLDIEVAQAFDAAMQRLSRRGAVIVPLAVAEFDEAAKANSGGGISPPEAYAVHRKWIDREQEIDPRVLERILRGGSLLAADYIDLLATRNRLAGRFARASYDIDVLVMPTVPRIAPPIEGLERNAETFRLANGNMLRNTSLINFLDGCALTLPIHAPREAPVGLMVVGFSGEDERVLSAGLAIEAALAYQGPVLVE